MKYTKQNSALGMVVLWGYLFQATIRCMICVLNLTRTCLDLDVDAVRRAARTQVSHCRLGVTA